MKKNKLPPGLCIAHFTSIKPIDVKLNGDGLYEGTFDNGETLRFYQITTHSEPNEKRTT